MGNTILAILIALFSLPAFAATMKFDHLGAWQARAAATQGTEAQFTQGADTILTLKQADGEVGPAVFVHKMRLLKSPSAKAEVEDWHQLVLGQMKHKYIVMNERLVHKDGETRYYVEYGSDAGTETMFLSTIMATVIDNNVYFFTYENHRGIYQNEIASVRQLLKNIQIGSK